MKTWLSDLQRLIKRDLDCVAKEMGMFPDDEAIWKTLPGITNSAGNLTLHVCGNLNHYIGHILGGSDYIRDRESEFNSTDESREDLFRTIAETKDVISRVIPKISDEQLAANFPETVGGVDLPGSRFLMHLTTHLAHHLGQIGYLRRILTEENKSSHPQSLKAIGKE